MAENELVIGVGCQRDTPRTLLARGIDNLLAELRLEPSRVRALATIEHKRDERGLHALAQHRQWPLVFYSAEELGDGVAEPAARLYAGHEVLLVPKRIYREPGLPGSMTIAIAELLRR